MSKVYVVLGVDTAVGAAVAFHLAKKATVKGVPLGSARGKGEVDPPPGVEVIRCDNQSVKTVEYVLKGCDGCFIFTMSDFRNDRSFMVNELAYGRTIAEACRKARVPHAIYCTEPHTTDIQGIGARHMVAKAEIEQCICVNDVPLTLLTLPRRYEDIIDYMAPRKVGQDFDFELPLDTDIPLNMISAEDLGPIVEKIFDNRAMFTDKRVNPGPISLCGSKVSRQTFAQCLSYNLQPLQFFDKPMTHTKYRDCSFNEPWKDDYANMFLFLMRTRWDHMYSDKKTRELNPDTKYFEEWIQANAQALYTAYTEVKPEDRLRWWFNKLYSRS
ncbi:nmrA-like family domain-containing protein 1 [Ylistrum balloti]|uniref:nmrA-like family domain-containing protein 1 n=1 Tax=Ylistrum balloti TaxID=509963 RepID=UPI002905EBB9|nr:nmrA-like family domain-containing protein 1 [Ylistrum balloti]